jgi:hypothetical protein
VFHLKKLTVEDLKMRKGEKKKGNSSSGFIDVSAAEVVERIDE